MLGRTEIPLADVALILGGRGRGPVRRVCLRNGEILGGAIRIPALTLASTSGLEIAVDPARMTALFLRSAKSDGQQEDGSAALLELLDGSSLGVAKPGDVRIVATTPWGDLSFPLADAVSIERQADTPGLRFALKDGSRFPGTLQTGSLRLSTVRFGDVEVGAHALQRWHHGTTSEARPHADAAARTSHVTLVDDTTLVGTLVDETLHLLTAEGASEIEVGKLRALERSDEHDDPVFLATMEGGANKAQGALREQILRIRTAHGLCRVPQTHVEEIKILAKGEAAATPPAGTAPEVAPKDEQAAKPAMSAADAQILKRLESARIQGLNWQNQNLDQAVMFLRTVTGVNMYITPTARKQKLSAVSITANVSGVTVAAVLNLITEPFDMAWRVKEGVVHIMTKDEAGGTKQAPPKSQAAPPKKVQPPSPPKRRR